MVSNRQVGSFFFQVFFWVKNSRHFSVEKETPYGWFHWRRVFVFLSIKPLFLDLPNSEKKRPTKTPPNRLLSQQAAGEWPCEGFSISKKWGHYRTPTPKHCTIIGKLLQNHHTFCMKFDTSPPKWGNLMTPAETSPQKMRHAWQNPSFLGRIPIRRLITSAPGT